jgi:hypothetical protein
MNQTYSLDAITSMVSREFSEYITASTVGTDAASYDVVRFTIEAPANTLDSVVTSLEQYVTNESWYDAQSHSVDTTQYTHSGETEGCIFSVYRHLMN